MAKAERLVLHVGLPKTGTSALQRWANHNRAALLGEWGIDYPEAGDFLDPKHQELISELMSGRTEALKRFLNCQKAPTLFLSTEGLTNHLYDFSPKSLEMFRAACGGIPIHVYMIIRNFEKWAESYYKQCLINPTNSRYMYGTHLDYIDFANSERVQRFKNHTQLAGDVKTAYGAELITVCNFESNWLSKLLQCLNVPDVTFSMDLGHVNESITADMAELIRQLNAMNREESQRKLALGYFQYVWNTNHVILSSYREKLAAEALLSADVQEVVGMLLPKNREQHVLVNRLRARLAI